MSLAPYRDLLRRPHARRLILCGLVGRIPVAAQSLALLLLVLDATGSYAMAGAVSAANGFSIGLFAPVQGRLIDALGQTRVLLVCAIGNPLALGLLTAVALRGAPVVALVACAVVAGALMPALSSALQVLWPGVAGGGERVGTAFALEAVAFEFSFVCGPLLAAVVSAAADPAAAVILAGGMTMLGTLGFAASTPSRAWRPHAKRSRNLAGALASPGVRTVALVAVPAGWALGSLEVALPAFADGRGAAELGGLLLAAVALGSTLGGLWYGTRRPKRSLARRWLELNVLLALGMLPLQLAWGVPMMAVACAVAGLSLAPLLSASWALIERVAPAGKVTDANTWYHTAMFAGTALGVAGAGMVVERVGIEAALAAPCVALGLAACLAATRRRTLALA